MDYDVKYNNLKRLYREVEEDNVDLSVKVIKLRDRIVQLRAKRSMLLSVLSKFDSEDFHSDLSDSEVEGDGNEKKEETQGTGATAKSS